MSPLELPIDHFRLLGVGPGMDAQSVLHGLQRRLDRLPDPGFSQEAIDARADLLRASADLLSDAERRAAYEAELTALASEAGPQVPALDLPASKEVAGLMLLLEAGQPLECFQLTCRCLQPPQAPVLRSSREADLTRLAGLSCLGAAAEFRHQRHFEAAAHTLREGLHLLQRMGLIPELREKMAQELDLLTPYRVLDLVSRDLGAKGQRQEGLELLEQLVRRRGGLEGEWDSNFSTEDFQPFFKQIRGFLTVQEQVDLFTRWGDEGSPAADFLATTALTASGFAQRKPERIAAARDRLEASGRSGIEPLLANLHLLLGDVEAAKASFAQGASPDLKAWAASHSPDPLAQLCEYCRDWLTRDVLPGYRDLEADADLEAYFSDRDVIAYVEKDDPKVIGDSQGFSQPFRLNDGGASASAPLSPAGLSFHPGATDRIGADGLEDELEEPVVRGWNVPEWIRWGSGSPRLAWLAMAGGVAAVLLLGFWLLRQRPSPPTPRPEGGGPASTSSAQQPSAPAAPANPNPTVAAAALPLRVEAPDGPQIQALLQAWLTAKATVLSGGAAPASLDNLARPGLIDRLEAERRADQARNQVQKIESSVRSVEIQERSTNRIAARAQIAYSDSRLDGLGQAVESTSATTLNNLYIFGRDDGTWRLVAFRSLN